MKKLLCWLAGHPAVRIQRSHADCLSRSEKSKALFVDKHKVYNIVRCTRCNFAFQGDQREDVHSSEILNP